MVSHDLSVLKYATHVLYLKEKKSPFLWKKKCLLKGMERRFIMTNFIATFTILFFLILLYSML